MRWLAGRRRVALHFLLAVCALVALSCSGNSGGAQKSSTATPAASEWPMLAHDLRSSFHNGAEPDISPARAAGIREAWQFKTSGSVTGTPAVAGGLVFVLAGGGTYALDSSTGAVLWTNTSVSGTSSPTYAGDKLYINDRKSVLHRLDAATGSEDWQAVIDPHRNAAGFSSPVVAGDRVIVGSASVEEAVAREGATFRGAIVAFGRTDGHELWRHYTAEPPSNGVAVWSSVSVDEDLGLVYGTTGNNYTGDAGPTSDSIMALELTTGNVRWSRQLSTGDVFTIPSPKSSDSDFGTNPILFEANIDGKQRRLLGAGQKSGMFWALDRETGDTVWSRKVSGGSALIGGVFNNGAFGGERIIVAGNNGTSVGTGSEPSNGASRRLGGASITTSVLMALNPADGAAIWERQLPAWVWAPITLAGGVGFVSADSELQAFDTHNGTKLFSFKTAGTIASGAAIADGRIFFGSGLPYLGTTADDKFHALALP